MTTRGGGGGGAAAAAAAAAGGADAASDDDDDDDAAACGGGGKDATSGVRWGAPSAKLDVGAPASSLLLVVRRLRPEKRELVRCCISSDCQAWEAIILADG